MDDWNWLLQEVQDIGWKGHGTALQVIGNSCSSYQYHAMVIIKLGGWVSPRCGALGHLQSLFCTIRFFAILVICRIWIPNFLAPISASISVTVVAWHLIKLADPMPSLFVSILFWYFLLRSEMWFIAGAGLTISDFFITTLATLRYRPLARSVHVHLYGFKKWKSVRPVVYASRFIDLLE